MSGPQRAPDQTGISVSMAKSLLEQIDARAKKLGLTRSQYFTHLARNDLQTGGSLIISETGAKDAPGSAGVRVVTKYPAIKRK
jgi:hypothetical protein